jgi:shikimate dehydrogenase
MISGSTRTFGLIGHPVRHSLSPAMHNELFRRKRVDAIYVAFDTRPEDASGVGPAIRTLALAGANLTVPFKERVLPDLDRLSPEAAAAGAVNVVVREDGLLVGHNTDGAGYVSALEEEMGVSPEGRAAVILGAGGTGRAIAAALAGRGARSVTLLNRTVARAEHACAALAPSFPGCAWRALALDAPSFRSAAADADLVVNCTSGEAAPLVGTLDVSALAPGSVWTDVNYWMSDPPRLVACVGRGIRIQRGIGMLIHQGALSFRLFTGVEVDGDTIRGVLDIGGW